MPPPSPAPKPTGKKLPKWAWLAAAAVGLLVGVLLLRRQASDQGTTSEEGGLEAEKPQGKGGSGGAIPFTDDMLTALGLQPPDDFGDFFYSGDGGSSDGGGDASFQSEYAAVGPTSPFAQGLTGTTAAGPSSGQEIYVSSPTTAIGPSFVQPQAPSATSGGTGSGSVKAQ